MSIQAKKSLGQHFLRSQKVVDQMVATAQIDHSDTILEIGPGKGVLTRALLPHAQKVVAVETDERCVTELSQIFAEEIHTGKLILIYGDIRNTEVQKKIFERTNLGTVPYKIVANIPYYITGMLFRLFLETLRQPSMIIFLVQKEVAQELVAKRGKESILSLSVKIFGDISYVATVKKEVFSPPPKVDSAIILVSHITKKRISSALLKKFFFVMKTGFGSRRKMLIGNLVRKAGLTRPILEKIFSEISIPQDSRAEDLMLSDWIKLTHALNKEL